MKRFRWLVSCKETGPSRVRLSSSPRRAHFQAIPSAVLLAHREIRRAAPDHPTIADDRRFMRVEYVQCACPVEISRLLAHMRRFRFSQSDDGRPIIGLRLTLVISCGSIVGTVSRSFADDHAIASVPRRRTTVSSPSNGPANAAGWSDHVAFVPNGKFIIVKKALSGGLALLDPFGNGHVERAGGAGGHGSRDREAVRTWKTLTASVPRRHTPLTLSVRKKIAAN